jgi:signal transduction histidine kinase
VKIQPHPKENGHWTDHAASLIQPTLSAELTARITSLSEQRDELSRLAEEQARSLAERDHVLAVMLHELKNALTVVIGRTQLARRHASASTSTADRAGADLARIERSVEVLAEQIAELLDVTLMQAGQSPGLQLFPCDLVVLTQQVVSDYQVQTDRHAIRVESAVPQLRGIWDAPRLARVLANLLSNAIKYSPDPGDIVVSLAREEAPDGGHAIITVRDQGIGISGLDLPHVFTLFHRAANVGPIGGTGLGLVSVKQVVELHGGTVSAESQEGFGTTMTIRLPLVMPSETAARPHYADI